jgi:hypothetical protein
LKNLSVYTLITLFASLFLFQACDYSEKNLHDSILSDLDSIQKELVPDRRIAVFNVTHDDQSLPIQVETDQESVVEAIHSLLNSNLNYNKKITIKSLPDDELGDELFGVVRVSVANLRRDPRHQAELIDQAVMGSELKILKKQGGWYYIQTPWDYLGWVTGESFTQFTEAELESNWTALDRVRVTSVDTRIFEEASLSSGVISDVTLGGTVRLINRGNQFSQIQLADSRTGYILSTHIGELIDTDNSTTPLGLNIIETAVKFHGLPYLWGGNSGKGFDCSGFTQTVFKDNGYMLPRDANMQVQIGDEVSIENNFEALEPGDLLYFGSNNRITHVGISLGGPKFIHASSYVMINSLDPADEDYTEYRRNTLQVVKRIR